MCVISTRNITYRSNSCITICSPLSQEITKFTIQWQTAFGAAGELKAECQSHINSGVSALTEKVDDTPDTRIFPISCLGFGPLLFLDPCLLQQSCSCGYLWHLTVKSSTKCGLRKPLGKGQKVSKNQAQSRIVQLLYKANTSSISCVNQCGLSGA